MAGAPFAEVVDVSAIWPAYTDAYEMLVEARIEKASRIVREQVPDVDTRITNGTLDPMTVTDVVVDMVERVVSVARYVRQESTTVDDGSESRTYVAAVAEGGMFISPDELRRLQGRSMARPRAFTIYPGPGPAWN